MSRRSRRDARPPTIVAMGGGGFSMGPGPGPAVTPLDEHILALTGRDRPRVAFLPTAGGDNADYIARFHAAFAGRAQAGHIGLFERTTADLRASVLDRDVVYVGGGNTANMLAVWRVHGLDEILREAWDAGIVLAGLSAGSLCWFTGGVTDSLGPDLSPLHAGLGFLPWSHCPHYDGDPRRRPAYQAAIAIGPPDGLPAGFAADDGAALVFHGVEFAEVVSERDGATAYRVERQADGTVRETPLPARRLPDPSNPSPRGGDHAR